MALACILVPSWPARGPGINNAPVPVRTSMHTSNAFFVLGPYSRTCGSLSQTTKRCIQFNAMINMVFAAKYSKRDESTRFDAGAWACLNPAHRQGYCIRKTDWLQDPCYASFNGRLNAWDQILSCKGNVRDHIFENFTFCDRNLAWCYWINCSEDSMASMFNNA